MELVDLAEAMRDAYMDFLEEFHAAGEPYTTDEYKEARKDFAGFVRKTRNHAYSLDMPDGWVPQSKLVLVRGGRVLGAIHLRYWLTEALKDFGGHVGYSIRPCERGKGYGTEMLRLMLEKVRKWGLARVLITCGKDNVASARVIQKNDGRLESEGFSKRAGKVVQRYWIEL